MKFLQKVKNVNVFARRGLSTPESSYQVFRKLQENMETLKRDACIQSGLKGKILT